MAGIDLASNFSLNAQLPLDDRDIVNDIAIRDALPNIKRYEGLRCFVKSEGKYYVLRGGITNSNWEPALSNGEVSVDKIAVIENTTISYDANGLPTTLVEIDENGVQRTTTFTYTNGVLTRTVQTGGERTIQEDISYVDGRFDSSTITIL